MYIYGSKAQPPSSLYYEVSCGIENSDHTSFQTQGYLSP